MTVTKPILDLFVDANILLCLAFCLWRGGQMLIHRSRLRHDHARQLTLMKTVFGLTLISPLLAYGAVMLGHWVFPNTPLTVSDIAVAAYLRGEIALPAVEFEAALSARNRFTIAVLEGQVPWATLALCIVALGGVYQAIRTVWSVARVRRAIEGSYLWRRTDRTEIRISDTVEVPFAARGLFRRFIVLPSSLLTHPRELRLVLAHEVQHLRSGDVEWELAFEALRPLLYWNPAFVLWKRSFDHLRELSCDQSVMQSRRISPSEYAQCLLEFCERRVSGPWPKAMSVAFVRAGHGASRRAFEARILAIFEGKRAQRSGLLVAAAATVLSLGLVLAAASVRQPGDWSQDRLMLSTIVNLERFAVINQGY
ncbi:MAG: M56 family metallopeptidase [Pseudomonadota bacterium]